MHKTRRCVYVYTVIEGLIQACIKSIPKKLKVKVRAQTQDELIARALDMEEGNIFEQELPFRRGRKEETGTRGADSYLWSSVEMGQPL